MKRAEKINYVGTAVLNSGAVRQLTRPGDCAVVHRGRPRSIVMVCPDGCGSVLTINLDGRSGKAWGLYLRKQTLSIFPSYWRVDGCRCHFIVWRNRILWCDSHERIKTPNVSSLHSIVLTQLSIDSYISYEAIADEIDEIPWDVLWSCRSLVRQGLVIEHPKSESFKKLPPEHRSREGLLHGSGGDGISPFPKR